MYQKFRCHLCCEIQLTDQEELRELHCHRSRHAECHHFELGSFSTVPWPVDRLESREEVVRVEVSSKLRCDDFSVTFDTQKIGDGPQPFQIVPVTRSFLIFIFLF